METKTLVEITTPQPIWNLWNWCKKVAKPVTLAMLSTLASSLKISTTCSMILVLLLYFQKRKRTPIALWVPHRIGHGETKTENQYYLYLRLYHRIFILSIFNFWKWKHRKRLFLIFRNGLVFQNISRENVFKIPNKHILIVIFCFLWK